MKVKTVRKSNKTRRFCGFRIGPDTKAFYNAIKIVESAVREVPLTKCLNYSFLYVTS